MSDDPVDLPEYDHDTAEVERHEDRLDELAEYEGDRSL